MGHHRRSSARHQATGAGSADQKRSLVPSRTEAVTFTGGSAAHKGLSAGVKPGSTRSRLVDRPRPPDPKNSNDGAGFVGESGAAAIEYAFAWAVRAGGFYSGGGWYLWCDELHGHTTHSRNRHT